MEHKRREWVKTAAIIFLAVMLILTFFSNTIMNYSLPEVSAQYVSSGTLSEQIRGTATIEAAESYTIKASDTRVVSAVKVKTGDTVEKGQVLVTLEEGDSSEVETALAELENAQNALETAEFEYRKMLLSTGTDYTLDELEIQNLEEDIEALKEEIAEDTDDLKNIDARQEEYEKAKQAVKDAKEKVNKLTKEQSSYDEQLTALSSEDYTSLSEKYYNSITAAQDKITEYEKTKTETDEEVQKIQDKITDSVSSTEIKKKKIEIDKQTNKIYQLQQKYSEALSSYDSDDETQSAEDYLEQLTEANYSLQEMQAEYNSLLAQASSNSELNNKLTYAQVRQKSATKDYDNAKAALDKLKLSISKEIKDARSKVTDDLEAANTALEEAQEAESEAKEKASVTMEDAEKAIKVKEDNLTSKQRELETKRITLAQQQQKDLESAGSSAIDIEEKQSNIQKQKDKISDMEEKVEKLRKEASSGEITAQVAGVIESINCIAGETLSADSTVATIQMTEKGYTASITVTSDQAKKVKVGDEAEIQYFWYGDAKAVLSSIKSDSSNPQSKQLVFNVTGDVSPGQSLQLVLGAKGQQYDLIVPNSAIREDNNGKFVLAVVSKSSPLGNRYTAKRIDVTVTASDDTKSAVTGELMQSDMIISTSTKPISAGDQVRFADSN